MLPKNVSRSVAVGSILKHDNAPSLLGTATAAAASKTSIALSPASPVPTYSTLPPPSSPTLRPEEDDAIHRGAPLAHLPAHLQPHRRPHAHTYGPISTPTALPSTQLEHTNANTPLIPGTPRAEADAEEPANSLPQNVAQSMFALWTKYDFILTISGDEPLIRRMNQLPQAGAVVETCSTSGKGSDAHWRLDPREEGVVKVLEELVNAKVDVDEGSNGGLLKPSHLELDPEEPEVVDVHA